MTQHTNNGRHHDSLCQVAASLFCLALLDLLRVRQMLLPLCLTTVVVFVCLCLHLLNSVSANCSLVYLFVCLFVWAQLSPKLDAGLLQWMFGANELTKVNWIEYNASCVCVWLSCRTVVVVTIHKSINLSSKESKNSWMKIVESC